ncbi:MAG: preprotein translocase subunit SecG [Bacteroidales bacterium]|nr:preprotein translocase subunit SecG [Bacteroidales bacterium]
MLYLFIIIVSVIIAVLLIGIVLIQKSKGGGLSSQFGNASAMMGVRQTNSFLEKGTWWLAGLLVVLSIASAYTVPNGNNEQLRTQQEQTAPLPGANQYDTNTLPTPGEVTVPTGEAPVLPPSNGKE